ncbi:hypothetical protein QUF64_09240 [Anaerolineales bacterium HSG6]|nr:hypothetical protein [Anaerolineales bacterium HSG6]MDM8531160.1 hypothetical protein [Anaerolineales bacterium HSG25]
MTINLNAITPQRMLGLIQNLFSETDQRWLVNQLNRLLTKPSLPLADKYRLVDQLCGSWKSDKSLDPIFSEIEEARLLNMPREVSFDAPS